jgi:hypothetical protein
VRALFEKHKAEMAERGFETSADAMNSGRLLLLDQTINKAE